ncbi:MAG: EAL domain-containing protein [Cyanobacteriota bacterium]
MSFAIDDFGTDYASLSNLSLVKAHKLKIDASFVRDLTTNADCHAILTASISMARASALWL